MTDQADPAGPDLSRVVADTVETWVSGLVDRSGKNRLLYLQPDRRVVLRLDGAATAAVSQLLAGEKVKLSQLITDVEHRKAAARAASDIRRQANRMFDEWGFSPLHLVLHTVTWLTASDRPTPCAPVFLCPLQLSILSNGADAALEADQDWEFNEALRLVLAEEHDLDLDPAEISPGDVGIADPAAALDEIQKHLSAGPAVVAEPLLAVANLEYANLPMARDLSNQVEELAKSDLIARVVRAARSRSATDREPRERIQRSLLDDRPAPPSSIGEELLVFTADASQARVVKSVVSGQHVVIEGPPGTGKSRTIANTIGALIAEGRSVLFVAEKRAAIDAVLDNLKEVDLDGLVLDLHGGVASRRAVKERLKDALEAPFGVPKPEVGVADDLYGRVATRLDTAAANLHTVHTEWGVSMWQAMERSLELPEEGRPEVTLDRSGEPVHLTALGDLTAAIKHFTDRNLGLHLLQPGNPWSGHLARHTITTVDEAGKVRVELMDLGDRHLPEFRRTAQELLETTGAAGPSTLREWSSLFDLLDEVQEVLRYLNPEAFQSSDLDELHAALTTRGAFNRFRSGARRDAERRASSLLRDGAGAPAGDLIGLVARAAAAVGNWQEQAPGRPFPSQLPEFHQCREAWLAVTTHADRLSHYLGHDIGNLEPASASRLLQSLRADDGEDILFELPHLRDGYQRLVAAGFGPLLRLYADGRRSTTNAAADVEHLWAAGIVERLRAEEHRESRSRGILDEAVRNFQERDQWYIASTPERIRRRWAERTHDLYQRHPDQYERLAQASRRPGVSSTLLRALLDDSPDVLLGVLPCWVMSPLVVSKLLPASHGLFDVVVFDEASQIKPVHAIPTLLRGRQVVVAGDDKQLPPNNQFMSGPDDDPDDDDPFDLTRGIDSLLNLVASLRTNVEQIQLSWHYRSTDERLIAFCNQRDDLYRGTLHTIPGIVREPPIEHVRVQEFGDERRISRLEQIDEEVVNLVLSSLHRHPGDSYGVITLNHHHADRIDKALMEASRDHPELVHAYNRARHPLCVKNIDTVQGDERDHVILTINLSRRPDGRLLNTLGPINSGAGVRRLNVALTRARKSMAVVTNFDADELVRFRSDGAQMLQAYLGYVAGGCIPFTGAAAAIPLNGFEQDVRRALEVNGIPHHCQYGVAGRRLDFALLHPDQPGLFVLAVECDGEQYHSSPSARDRDRFRQENLEKLGWKFHRIWCTEWYRRRDTEIGHLLDAYRRAVEAADLQRSDRRRRPAQEQVTTTDITQPSTTPTRPRRPRVPKRARITDYRPGEIEKIVRWVQTDTLIRDDLVREAAHELGVKRVTAKARAEIQRAIDAVATERSQP